MADNHDDMLAMVERSMASAESALSRRVSKRRATEGSSAPSEGNSPAASTKHEARPQLSTEERRSILARLAAERIEARGFASDRELQLTAQETETSDAPAADDAPTQPRAVSQVEAVKPVDKQVSDTVQAILRRRGLLQPDNKPGTAEPQSAAPTMTAALIGGSNGPTEVEDFLAEVSSAPAPAGPGPEHESELEPEHEPASSPAWPGIQPAENDNDGMPTSNASWITSRHEASTTTASDRHHPSIHSQRATEDEHTDEHVSPASSADEASSERQRIVSRLLAERKANLRAGRRLAQQSPSPSAATHRQSTRVSATTPSGKPGSFSSPGSAGFSSQNRRRAPRHGVATSPVVATPPVAPASASRSRPTHSPSHAHTHGRFSGHPQTGFSASPAHQKAAAVAGGGMPAGSPGGRHTAARADRKGSPPPRPKRSIRELSASLAHGRAESSQAQSVPSRAVSAVPVATSPNKHDDRSHISAGFVQGGTQSRGRAIGPVELDPSTYGAGVLAAEAGYAAVAHFQSAADPIFVPESGTAASNHMGIQHGSRYGAIAAASPSGRQAASHGATSRHAVGGAPPALPRYGSTMSHHAGERNGMRGARAPRASTGTGIDSAAAAMSSVPMNGRAATGFASTRGVGATFALPPAPMPHDRHYDATAVMSGSDSKSMEHNADGTHAGVGRSGRGRSTRPAGKLPVWERLAMAQKAKEARLEAQRRAREQEAMADCTFAPGKAAGDAPSRLQVQAQATDGLPRSDGGAPVRRSASAASVRATVARLHGEASTRSRHREELARQAKDAEAASHPYHPEINSSAGGLAGLGADLLDATATSGRLPADPRPLHERAFDLQRRKQEELARRRIAAMTGDAELTFQPVISKRSSRIVQASRRGGESEGVGASASASGELTSLARGASDRSGAASHTGMSVAQQAEMSERLLREADARKLRAAKRRAKLAEEEASRLTFEPRVNEHSARLVEENPSMRMGFLERQRSFVEAKQRKIDAAKDAEAAQCTFKPKTRGADALLAYTRPELAAESERDRVERLARGDAERGEQLKQAISDEYYAQFQFKPKINDISKRLGRAHTVDEHHKDEQRRAAIARAKEAAEREEMRQCTFQPELQTDPDAVLRRAEARRGEGRGPFRLDLGQDPDGLAARIGEHERRKQAKLRRMRRAQEYEELESCSFVPKPVSHAPVVSTKPVVVRGLARHLEKVEMAEAKRADQEQREAEAFIVRGAQYKSQGETTVPQPFRLETESNPRRRARAARDRAQAEAEAMKECRFRPDVGGMSSELEAELLEDIEEDGSTNPRALPDAASSTAAAGDSRVAAARAAAAALR